MKLNPRILIVRDQLCLGGIYKVLLVLSLLQELAISSILESGTHPNL